LVCNRDIATQQNLAQVEGAGCCLLHSQDMTLGHSQQHQHTCSSANVLHTTVQHLSPGGNSFLLRCMQAIWE
jgi:hypothetical protein